MKISHRARAIWHDFYYWLFGRRGVEYALRCRDVAAKIDLRTRTTSREDRIRVRLHLSICQACRNYLKFREVISSAAREVNSTRQANSASKPVDESVLTQRLLERFSRDPEC